jgi:phage-related baseplate assembly protein
MTIQFVNTDAEQIANEMISAYEAEVGQVLYPGDPRRIFLLQFVPLLVAAKNDINYTGLQNLLPYAADEMLDALGELMRVRRLQANPSRTTVRFTLSSVQLDNVVVPQATRITPDGVTYFATSTPLTIPPGSTSGDVMAESTLGGERYNGFVAGQINIIVDRVPYVASAANIDTSAGGMDRESNDAYRERIRLAPASFSVAGPEDAYIYHAKSADVSIIDVKPVTPSANEIKVYVLLKGGQLPDPTIVAKVEAALNKRDVRPLTDHVEVLAPEEMIYNVELTYYIWAERSTEVTTIRASIEDPGGAIDQYVDWQRSKLGRSITPDNLLAKMYAAGAARIVVTAPVYAQLEDHEVAKLGTTTITYGGLI